MNFWNFEDLSRIHIELTNACNAACPMCARFYLNSPNVRPDLKLAQITLEQFKNYFPPYVLKKLSHFQLCGTHGDPGMAKDVYEICEYIYLHASDNIVVQMHTNGGMRNPEWWEKMGKLFSFNKNPKNPWRMIFSIDGLEDTNHLYRRNVNWQKLKSNAEAFIKGGGIAIWEYLIFKHNEHQIEEAKQLSASIGFTKIILKTALGVSTQDGYLRPLPANDRQGNLEYIIEAPTKAEHRNLSNPKGEKPIPFYPFNYNKDKVLDDYETKVDNAYAILDTLKNVENLNDCEINCKMKGGRAVLEIFVDNFGKVIPCCYMGTHINGQYTDFASLQTIKHMKDHGWDKFDLNKFTLKEILDAGHLNTVFADSWSKPSIKEGKIAYCASICGQESHVDKIYKLKNR